MFNFTVFHNKIICNLATLKNALSPAHLSSLYARDPYQLPLKILEVTLEQKHIKPHIFFLTFFFLYSDQKFQFLGVWNSENVTCSFQTLSRRIFQRNFRKCWIYIILKQTNNNNKFKKYNIGVFLWLNKERNHFPTNIFGKKSLS